MDIQKSDTPERFGLCHNGKMCFTFLWVFLCCLVEFLSSFFVLVLFGLGFFLFSFGVGFFNLVFGVLLVVCSV